MIATECREAMEEGVELHGICIYPIVGMTDWQTDEFRQMGLWDRAGLNGELRIPHPSTIRMLRALQRQFKPRKQLRRKPAEQLITVHR